MGFKSGEWWERVEGKGTGRGRKRGVLEPDYPEEEVEDGPCHADGRQTGARKGNHESAFAQDSEQIVTYKT